LQSVHNCCNLLQIQESANSASRWARPISLVDEGQIGTDGLGFTAAPQKARSGLVHLRSLLSVLPATNTGQVTAAWDQIEAGLARGMKLREVWEAAKLDGLAIPYPQFRVYVSRLRRRQRRSTSAPTPTSALTTADRGLPDPPPDPFRNLREQREKKKDAGFDYDPFSINKNLID